MNRLLLSITALVMIGIVLGAGLLVLGEFTNRKEIWDTQAMTNDTITLLNGTAVSLTENNLVACPTILYNATGGQALNAGNFTCSATAGSITLTQNAYNNTDYNASYHYYKESAAVLSINETTNAISGFPGWLAVIIVVLMASVILGIVIRSFGNNDKI